MNIKLNDNIGAVKFNGAEIDLVKFNGAEVWSSGKKVSGVPPLILEGSNGKPLKDYKIYGNSVQNSTPSADNPAEIESVGDIKNLFDLQGWYTWLKSFGTSDTYVKKVTVDGISCILYRPPGTYDKQYMKGEFKENTQYALSFRAKGITGSGVSTGFRFQYTDGSSSGVDVAADGEWKDYKTISKADKTIDYIWMWFGHDQGCYIDENSVQLEEGAAATEYVPYGKYVIPVEVSENVYATVQTVNIVLSEPLRKIGSYADYIDFKNQKLVQYVLETPTETSMELPEIGTFSGNTLIKVKTHVQPSSVSVIYR